MRSAIVLIVARAAPLHDEAFAPLIEDLRDTGHQPIARDALEKANPHVTGGERGRLPRKTPRYAARLVVERGVKIPSSCRLVLQSPPFFASAGGRRSIRVRPQQLTGQLQFQ